MQRLLIIGSGDVARRALPRLAKRYRIYALVRDAENAAAWRAAGAVPVMADLDDRKSLCRLVGLAQGVLHLAPPPAAGEIDSRTRNLLAALAKGKSLPRSLVYISTTGIYGDCQGDAIDETRAPLPATARARRRADAERRLRAFGRRLATRVTLLRAPGIYAADRLPLERINAGAPVLIASEDPFSNHIHADDLAAACIAALRRGKANRAYNVVDDSDIKMGDYFDRVADAFGLPRPPRLKRGEISRVLSPVQLSFMDESRRISNRRLKAELKLRLAYPTVDAGLQAAFKRKK